MLPRRFRIFRKGVNPSSKGPILFDEQAAKDVMACYQQQAVKVMIDLEHLSLDDTASNYDPDARGWTTFELDKGELWASTVEWTPDGATRLEDKRQRYISPAFTVDKETRRVKAVVNLALVGMPATHDAQDLLAASRFARLSAKFPNSNVETLTLKVDSMPPEILQMLGLPPEATAEDVVAALKALMAKTASKDTPPPVPGAEAEKMAAKILALTTRAEAGDKAVEELAKIRKAEEESKRSVLLSKLPKNLEEWGNKQSIASLEEFIKHSAPRIEEEQIVESDKDKLTAVELEACKATGTDPEAFLKFKKGNK
jgi:phage I-like protein